MARSHTPNLRGSLRPLQDGSDRSGRTDGVWYAATRGWFPISSLTQDKTTSFTASSNMDEKIPITGDAPASQPF